MNNSATASGSSIADLGRAISLLEGLGPMPRDVFLFEGSVDEFVRCLGETGVELVAGMTDLHALPMWPMTRLPIGGAEVVEIGGKTWIGSPRDIRDAREGKIPFRTIERRPR